jgi:hypothetical protein
MKLLSKGILFAVALGLVGCGGGSGGGGSTAVPTGTQFLTFADATFLYDLTGTQTTDADGTRNVSNGTRRVYVASTSTDGLKRLETVDAFDLPGGDTGAFDLRVFVTQAGNHDVSVQTLSHGADSLLTSSSNLFIPGIFAEGLSFSRTYTYFGGSATYSFTVGELTEVSVPYYPSGKAQVYPVTASLHFSNGYKREGTYYYSPTLGTYLSADETITETSGQIGTFSVKLRSITPG